MLRVVVRVGWSRDAKQRIYPGFSVQSGSGLTRPTEKNEGEAQTLRIMQLPFKKTGLVVIPRYMDVSNLLNGINSQSTGECLLGLSIFFKSM